MMLARKTLWLLTASLTLVLAEPIGFRRPKIDCDKVSDAVADAKRLGRLATEFCEAYLHIPTATTTLATLTPTSVVYTTITATVTSSVCPATTTAAPVKRGWDTKPHVPLGLAKYLPEVVSSACNCLSLPPPATVTSTITAAPSIVTSALHTTECVSCAANGQPCALNNPGACCGQVCVGNQLSTTCSHFG